MNFQTFIRDKKKMKNTKENKFSYNNNIIKLYY